jgi:hypothetical protein
LKEFIFPRPAHLSAAYFYFDCTGRSPDPARCPLLGGRAHHAKSHSVPVATDHRRPMWAGPLIPVPEHHHRRPSPVSLPSPTDHHRPMWAGPLIPVPGHHHRFAHHRQPPMSRLQVVWPNQKKHPITAPLPHRELAHVVV